MTTANTTSSHTQPPITLQDQAREMARAIQMRTYWERQYQPTFEESEAVAVMLLSLAGSLDEVQRESDGPTSTYYRAGILP